MRGAGSRAMRKTLTVMIVRGERLQREQVAAGQRDGLGAPSRISPAAARSADLGERIGHPHHAHPRRALHGEQLGHRAAEPAGQVVLFGGSEMDQGLLAWAHPLA